MKRTHSCPHCGDKRTIKWGKLRNERKRFKCKTCNHTFSENTKYPPTNLPFKFVARMLYMYIENRRRITIPQMVKFINNQIRFLPKKYHDISIPTFYKWIENYMPTLENYVTKRDATLYFNALFSDFQLSNRRLKQLIYNYPNEKVTQKQIWIKYQLGTKQLIKENKKFYPHSELLCDLQKHFGIDQINLILKEYNISKKNNKDLVVNKIGNDLKLINISYKKNYERFELYSDLFKNNDCLMIFSSKSELFKKEVEYNVELIPKYRLKKR